MTQPAPDPSVLTSLLTRPESHTFEVKRLKGGELSRCLQSLAAFANSDGGLLVLGLEDPGKAFGSERLYGVFADMRGRTILNAVDEQDLTTTLAVASGAAAVRVRSLDAGPIRAASAGIEYEDTSEFHGGVV